MSILLPGDLIKILRGRKSWTRDDLEETTVSTGDYAEIHLANIEANENKPRQEIFDRLLGSLGAERDTVFMPFLDNQSLAAYKMRDDIRYLIKNYKSPNALDRAEALLAKLDQEEGMVDGRNLQLILSLRVQLYTRQNKPPEDIIPLIYEAMDITYSDFDQTSFDPSYLYLEEPVLLHYLAIAQAKSGKAGDAISLLKSIVHGLQNTSMDEYTKEKMLPSVYLTLVKTLVGSQRYDEAAKYCIRGHRASTKRDDEALVPDFLYQLAICYYNIGNPIEACRSLLQCAYFSYAMLHRSAGMAKTLARAEEYAIDFPKYDVDKLVMDPPEIEDVGYGAWTKSKYFGEFVEALRNDKDIGRQKLVKGICTVTNLVKIENGEIQGNIYHLEAIMQRLGRHIHHYITLFPSKADFEEINMRDRINNLMIVGEHGRAEALVKILEKSKKYQKNINRQVILGFKAEIERYKNGKTKAYESLLKQAIDTTIPKFNPDKIEKYPLCYYEIITINMLANYYADSKDPKLKEQGINMLEGLIRNMDANIVDEHEKKRMYTLVLYNYSKYLGRAGRYGQGLEVALKGINLALKHDRFDELPGLITNKACDMLELGQQKESLPWFAICFYGKIAMGKAGSIRNVRATFNYVKERLGIALDHPPDYSLRSSFSSSMLNGENASSQV